MQVRCKCGATVIVSPKELKAKCEECGRTVRLGIRRGIESERSEEKCAGISRPGFRTH